MPADDQFGPIYVQLGYFNVKQTFCNTMVATINHRIHDHGSDLGRWGGRGFVIGLLSVSLGGRGRGTTDGPGTSARASARRPRACLPHVRQPEPHATGSAGSGAVVENFDHVPLCRGSNELCFNRFVY